MNGLAAIYIAVGAKDFFAGEDVEFVLEGFPDLAALLTPSATRLAVTMVVIYCLSLSLRWLWVVSGHN